MQPSVRAASILFSLILLVLALTGSGITASRSSRQAIHDEIQRENATANMPGELNGSQQARDWFARGQAARASGDLLAAAKAWELSRQYGAPPGLVYSRLAEAHENLGDLDSLADDLQVLVSQTPADPAWQYQLGLVQIILQPEAAYEHLLAAAELDPDLEQAVSLLKTGLSLSRLSADPAFRMVASGRALASTGEWQFASAAFSRAIQLDPNYAEAWAFLGEAHHQLGEDGLPELQKAVDLDNQSVAANTLLGLYWQRSGRLDLALVYLKAAVRQNPDNPVLQEAIGELLAQQGNLPAALWHYQSAAEASPRDPAYWRSLSVFTIEYDIQVKEVGLPAARTAVLLNNKDPASLDTLAQAYISLGNPLIAERFLQRALVYAPDYAPAHLHLGLVNLLKGDASTARSQLHLAETLSPAGSETAEHTRRLLLNLKP